MIIYNFYYDKQQVFFLFAYSPKRAGNNLLLFVQAILAWLTEVIKINMYEVGFFHLSEKVIT